MTETKIEDELIKSIKNIKNLLEDIQKDGDIFKKVFENIYKIGKDFKETIKNILKDNNFDNIKPIYKNFSELVSSLYKSIDGIKQKKNDIQKIISDYENFRDNKNYNKFLTKKKMMDNFILMDIMII